MRANQSIRDLFKERGVTHWQVADELGISPSTMSIWLRRELEDDKRQMIETAVESLTQAGEQRG